MKNQEKIMELVLDHSGNPRNYGVLELADITQEGGNPGCGDIIKIYLTVDTDGVVDEIKFSGEGCMISQAGASLMVEKMKGKSIEEIQAMSPDAVIDILGKKLVSTRPRCAMLGFNTVKNAIKRYKKQEMLSSIEGE
jgi:nitrogen fixation NifU-like protein